MTNHQAPTAPKRIEWSGGECPVSPGTRVRVWLRNMGDQSWTREAHTWNWKHHDALGDIVAYSILEPDWAVEGPRLRDAAREIAEAFRHEAKSPAELVRQREALKINRALLDRIDGGAR